MLKKKLISSLDQYAPRLALSLRARFQRYTGEPEIRLLPLLVPPDRHALDIGANNGVYTYWLSRLAAGVTTVDPNPDCIHLLRRSLGGNADIVAAACGHRKQQAKLYVPVSHGVQNNYRGTLEEIAPGTPVKSWPIQVVPVDQLGISPPGFIKIDVEGHELDVLEGAKKTLNSSRPVVLMETEERHRPGALRAVCDIFAALGYEGFFYFGSRVLPIASFDRQLHQGTPPTMGASGPRYVNNFMFVPQEQRSRIDALLMK